LRPPGGIGQLASNAILAAFVSRSREQWTRARPNTGRLSLNSPLPITGQDRTVSNRPWQAGIPPRDIVGNPAAMIVREDAIYLAIAKQRRAAAM
jgi:hypothetical protein